MDPQRTRGRGGFSLVELMVVLVLIGLATALILPRLGAGWGRLEDREFLQELVRTLRAARILALNTGSLVVVRIRGADRLYGIGAVPAKRIPKEISIYAEHLPVDPATGDHVILFYPDGSQAGAELQVVTANRKSFRIHLHPLFGTVSWERES